MEKRGESDDQLRAESQREGRGIPRMAMAEKSEEGKPHVMVMERLGQNEEETQRVTVQETLGPNEQETLHVTVEGRLGENEAMLNESGEQLEGRDLPVIR